MFGERCAESTRGASHRPVFAVENDVAVRVTEAQADVDRHMGGEGTRGLSSSLSCGALAWCHLALHGSLTLL